MKNPTLDDLIDQLEKMAKGIDFAKLERQGVVTRVGTTGTWFRIHNLKALPAHWGYLCDAFHGDLKGGKFRFPKRYTPGAIKLLKDIKQFKQRQQQRKS
ncbi:MAG: hypothetical protein ACLP56_17470 [Candidatus Sulfotelmatobacter sp.]